MKNLLEAMDEEKNYISDRLNNINTSFKQRIEPYGYSNINEYFQDKRDYFFNEWYPEVYYVDVSTLTEELEKAVRNEQYGIYISVADGLYAFHGSDEIDYDLCSEMGICVAELYHIGGTIIGDSQDLGIEIVAPKYIGLDDTYILNKFYSILSNYIENLTIAGNDILADGKKILGSMHRNVGNAFVWAAQISFSNHTDIISKICHKSSMKMPGNIDNQKLNRDELEKEVLRWLQKH